MMPIKAIHARRIFRGEKTLELRKSRPMAVGEYRVLLYISKEKGKEKDLVQEYARGRQLYGLCVEEPKLYREPRELESYGIQRPPQNWRWVENDAEIH